MGRPPPERGPSGSVFEVGQDVCQVRGVVAAELFEEVDLDVHWGFLSLFPPCCTPILSTATPAVKPRAVCSPPHFQVPYATVTYHGVTYGAVAYSGVTFADVAITYTYEAVTYHHVTYSPVTFVNVTYHGVTYTYVAVTYGYVGKSWH